MYTKKEDIEKLQERFLKNWTDEQFKLVKTRLNTEICHNNLYSLKGYKDSDYMGAYTSSSQYALFGICGDQVYTKSGLKLGHIAIGTCCGEPIIYAALEDEKENTYFCLLNDIAYLAPPKVEQLEDKIAGLQYALTKYQDIEKVINSFDKKVYNCKFDKAIDGAGCYCHVNGQHREIVIYIGDYMSKYHADHFLSKQHYGYNEQVYMLYKYEDQYTKEDKLLYQPDPNKNTLRINAPAWIAACEHEKEIINKQIEKLKDNVKNYNKYLEQAKKIKNMKDELYHKLTADFKEIFKYDLPIFLR